MFQNKLHLSKHKCNGFCALLVPTNLIIGPVISRAQGRVSIILESSRISDEEFFLIEGKSTSKRVRLEESRVTGESMDNGDEDEEKKEDDQEKEVHDPRATPSGASRQQRERANQKGELYGWRAE